MSDVPSTHQEVRLVLPKKLVDKLKPYDQSNWRRNTLEREIQYRLEYTLEQTGGNVFRKLPVTLQYQMNQGCGSIHIRDLRIFTWAAPHKVDPLCRVTPITSVVTGFDGMRDRRTERTQSVEETFEFVRRELPRVMLYWAVDQVRFHNENAAAEAIKIQDAIGELLFRFTENREAATKDEVYHDTELIGI